MLQVPLQQEVVYKKPAPPIQKAQRKVKALKPVDSKDIEISVVPNEVYTQETISMALPESYEELQLSMPENTVTVAQSSDHDYFRSQEYTDVETIWIKPAPPTEIVSDSGINDYFLAVEDISDDQAVSSTFLMFNFGFMVHK